MEACFIGRPSIEYYIDDITTIINEWDPVDLIRFDATEYQSEIDEVVSRIRPTSSINAISRCLKKVFTNSFGDVCDCTVEDYNQIAQKIYDVFQANT